MIRITQFIKSESGAVTADWVVLTAAVIGLGGAVMTSVGAGTTDLADDVYMSIELRRFYLGGNYNPAQTFDEFIENGDSSTAAINAVAPPQFLYLGYIEVASGLPIYISEKGAFPQMGQAYSIGGQIVSTETIGIDDVYKHDLDAAEAVIKDQERAFILEKHGQEALDRYDAERPV